MIVAESKPLEEIFEFIKDKGKVLVLGCGECVTVCQTGGEKEVAILAQALRLKAGTEGKEVTFLENTVQRQCDIEFVAPVLEDLDGIDAVISTACGVGVNFLSDQDPPIEILPGVNTTHMGATVEHGVWEERCGGCGECILHMTGGICPIARCSKSILNGPCGGTNNGECEISTPDNHVDCAWALIIKRAGKLGTLDRFDEVVAPKDWSTARDGGPRRRVRPDLKINKDEVANEAS